MRNTPVATPATETFAAAVLGGRASLADADDWVVAWHDSPDDGKPLHQHLGLTWGEYAAWVASPDRLEEIVSAIAGRMSALLGEMLTAGGRP